MNAPVSPEMAEEEVGLLTSVLCGKKHLLEFGAGGSTLLALRLGVDTVVSVDSDPEWLRRVVDGAAQLRPSAVHRLRPVHADIGPTARWGYPADDGCRPSWPNYWRGVWDTLERPESIDCVLVDGRFRVACVLSALTRLAGDVPILMHDFPGRPHYNGVLRHVSARDSAGTLIVLHRHARLDQKLLVADLASHAFDPR